MWIGDYSPFIVKTISFIPCAKNILCFQIQLVNIHLSISDITLILSFLSHVDWWLFSFHSENNLIYSLCKEYSLFPNSIGEHSPLYLRYILSELNNIIQNSTPLLEEYSPGVFLLQNNWILYQYPIHPFFYKLKFRIFCFKIQYLLLHLGHSENNLIY